MEWGGRGASFDLGSVPHTAWPCVGLMLPSQFFSRTRINIHVRMFCVCRAYGRSCYCRRVLCYWGVLRRSFYFQGGREYALLGICLGGRSHYAGTRATDVFVSGLLRTFFVSRTCCVLSTGGRVLDAVTAVSCFLFGGLLLSPYFVWTSLPRRSIYM